MGSSAPGVTGRQPSLADPPKPRRTPLFTKRSPFVHVPITHGWSENYLVLPRFGQNDGVLQPRGKRGQRAGDRIDRSFCRPEQSCRPGGTSHWPRGGCDGKRPSERCSPQQVPSAGRCDLGHGFLHRCLRLVRNQHRRRLGEGPMASIDDPDQLGRRLHHPGGVHRGGCVRPDRRRSRTQERLCVGRRDHDRGGRHLCVRHWVLVARDRSLRARTGHWRRLSRLGGPHERVCQPRRPGSPGWVGVLDAGPGAHRGTARRIVTPVVRGQPRPHLAPDARLRRCPCRRCRLPTGENARVTSLPSASAGRSPIAPPTSWLFSQRAS